MKERAKSTTGFEHDRPYMKLDIWCPGEIEKKWGHDPATYPDQDLLQHYPTIQFNPSIAKDGIPEYSIDSNLNVHTELHQSGFQTSRPGFMNKPSGTHDDFESVHAVDQESANAEGLEYAKANCVKIQE